MGFFEKNDPENQSDLEPTNDPNATVPPVVDNSSEQNQEEHPDPNGPEFKATENPLGMSDENNNATKYLYRDINGYVRLVDNVLMFTPLLNPEDPLDDTFDANHEREVSADNIGEVRYNEIVSELRERY